MYSHVHPSILSADFVNFERDFLTISTADAIHVDVMDGHFVPNLTFGLPMVKRMVEVAQLPIDVHLMIDSPDRDAVSYADAGAASVTFHLEAATDPIKIARALRASGSKAAIAVKPATGLEFVLDHLDDFDMLLIMTVEPGFGGQKFIAEMLPKVVEGAEAIAKSGKTIRLQVDGGIDLSNIVTVSNAGADTFVAGSSVFSSEDRNSRIIELRDLAQSAK
jgi:ribulose-phosphate 3-epimerase